MKNISIGVKVMLPVILLVFLLAGTCYSNVVNMDRMIGSSREISGDYAKSMSLLGSLSTAFEALERAAYAHCVTGSEEDMDLLGTQINSISGEISSLCTEYEGLIDGNEEKEAYATFQNLYSSYRDKFEQAIAKSLQNEKIPALAIVNGEMSDTGLAVFTQISDMRNINQGYMEKAIANSESTYNGAKKLSYILFAAAFIIAAASMAVCIFGITRPVLKSSKELGVIISGIEAEKGDLSKRITVNGKDEISKMGDGINSFMKILQVMMRKITNSSRALDKMAEEVKESVSSVNISAYDISAAMEELSSSMEEVAATSSNVNNNAGIVGDNVKELAKASKDLSAYAGEMKNRAARIEKDAKMNKEDARNVVAGILSFR